MNNYHRDNILDSLLAYLLHNKYIYHDNTKTSSIILDIYLKRFDIVKYKEVTKYLKLLFSECYLQTSNRLIIVNALKELGPKTTNEDKYDQIFINLYQLLDNKIKSLL